MTLEQSNMPAAFLTPEAQAGFLTSLDKGPGLGGWVGPVVFAAVCLAVAAATAWSARETAQTDLHALGAAQQPA